MLRFSCLSSKLLPILTGAAVCSAQLTLVNSQNFPVLRRTIASNSVKMFSTSRGYIDDHCVLGIIFDMDGTLTMPHAINFDAMYTRNGLQRRENSDILTLVNELPSVEQRERALEIILEEEMIGCDRMELRPHLHDLVAAMESAKVPRAISTRNCALACDKFFHKANLNEEAFHPRIHRDSLNGVNKPDPAVAFHILSHWGISPDHAHKVWFVGDSVDDMACGKQAGCRTCLIATDKNHITLETHRHLVDIRVESLAEFAHHINLPFNPSPA